MVGVCLFTSTPHICHDPTQSPTRDERCSNDSNDHCSEPYPNSGKDYSIVVINLVDLPCCDQNSAAVLSTQSIILNDIPAPPPLAENSDAVTEIEGLVAAAAGSTSTTTTKFPPNLSKSIVLYSEFINLPNADEHCSKVDVAGGGWVWCCLCNMEVASRSGRPFILVRWSEHKSNKSHCMKMKSTDLKRKPECDLDRFKQSRVKNKRKTQFGLASFFFGKKKNSVTDMSKSCANPSSDVAVGLIPLVMLQLQLALFSLQH